LAPYRVPSLTKALQRARKAAIGFLAPIRRASRRSGRPRFVAREAFVSTAAGLAAAATYQIVRMLGG
jgi:hypothetical protein